MSKNLRKNLLGCMDKILGVRENLGVQLADVSIITRTWSGKEVGEGSFTDSELIISPQPQIVDFGHDLRLNNSAAVRQGDLILKQISQNKFSRKQLSAITGLKNVEKFYKLNDDLYVQIHLRERLITWDVHIRKLSNRGG